MTQSVLYLYLLMKQIVFLVVRHRNRPRSSHKLPTMPSICKMIRIYFKITADLVLIEWYTNKRKTRPQLAQWPSRSPSMRETSVRPLVPTLFPPPPRANGPAHMRLVAPCFLFRFFFFLFSFFKFIRDFQKNQILKSCEFYREIINCSWFQKIVRIS